LGRQSQAAEAGWHAREPLPLVAKPSVP
jgi:hypothetical protein